MTPQWKSLHWYLMLLAVGISGCIGAGVFPTEAMYSKLAGVILLVLNAAGIQAAARWQAPDVRAAVAAQKEATPTGPDKVN